MLPTNFVGPWFLLEVEDSAIPQQPALQPKPGPSQVLVHLELEDADDPMPAETASSPQGISDRAAREVTRYMETPLGRVDDSLAFWRFNASSHPLLAKVARKYLGVPAANTAAERAKSLAGARGVPACQPSAWIRCSSFAKTVIWWTAAPGKGDPAGGVEWCVVARMKRAVYQQQWRI